MHAGIARRRWNYFVFSWSLSRPPMHCTRLHPTLQPFCMFGRTVLLQAQVMVLEQNISWFMARYKPYNRNESVASQSTDYYSEELKCIMVHSDSSALLDRLIVSNTSMALKHLRDHTSRN
ncbi:hypothetical protein J6590_096545 [Homalodisca vitripennis]|nr:hypothetical protein J6590_096545 [Homalodisca vitripennis]